MGQEVGDEDPDGQARTRNVEITFWSPHVFRIQFSHDPIPATASFPPPEARMLVAEPAKFFEFGVEERPSEWIARTTAVVLHVEKDPFTLWTSDLHGQVIWQQRRADLFTADTFDMAVAAHQNRPACFESFALIPQEEIFGLGERFDHVPRTGRAVDFWNKDAIGSSSPRSYINVPFLFSTQGYGLFVNASCRTEWEIGTLDAFTLGFAVEDNAMDYFIIHGPAPAEILLRYAELRRLQRRLLLLHPPGCALSNGAFHVLPHQRRQHRAVRAHVDCGRGRCFGQLPGRLHRAHAG